MSVGTYVQYGCGYSAPSEWVNFDASPTLRIQRLPLLGGLFRKRMKVSFPKNVKYGDIVKGLPLEDNSCDGLYCSHVLEHLSYEDFIRAIKNSYRVLKPGGTFRLVMPDLENLVRSYLENKNKGNPEASVAFMANTGIAFRQRPRGLIGMIRGTFGNAHHLWLWDTDAAIHELQQAGFKDIRKCGFNDSGDKMFHLVEDSDRFDNALALEMRK